MKLKLIPLTLFTSTLLAAPYISMAQADSSKPMVIDAAVTDTVYQLYEGTVTKIDKKSRTIYFKNDEGESKFVAGPEIKNLIRLKKVIV